MGLKIKFGNKEVEINTDKIEVADNYLKSLGAQQIKRTEGENAEFKTAEFSADPITPIVILIGVGTYIYYRITQSGAQELKQNLPSLN